MLVTIRPPDVIPGIARVDVRAFDGDVRGVRVVPLPMAGPGAASPPVADVAVPSRDDPQLYGSSLWLMRAGSWKIRVTVDGARGSGELSVPIPALARATRPMPPYLGGLLVAVMSLLVAAAIAIAGASARESDLPPGAQPDRRRLARGRRAMAVTGAVLALAIWGGRRWWRDEAVRVPEARLQASRRARSASRRRISWPSRWWIPGWLKWRRTDDLIPDHGHLMHLFLVRTPGLDAIAHLHPRRDADGTFEQAVPPLPAGGYRLYGDLVHANGIDETVTTALTLAGTGSAPKPDGDRFDPDDAVAVLPRAATRAGARVRVRPTARAGCVAGRAGAARRTDGRAGDRGRRR